VYVGFWIVAVGCGFVDVGDCGDGCCLGWLFDGLVGMRY